MKRDYYEVLGVAKDSDDEAIRRAFHRLARDWHPDVAHRPEAEAEFRELAEAYSVLSNREARRLYDRYGYRGRGNREYDEALSTDPAGAPRADDVHLRIAIRNLEAVEGVRRLVSYGARLRCTTCSGRGSLGLPDPGEQCPQCAGEGTVLTERKLRVIMPPGVEDEAQLRVNGEGNEGVLGSVPGDLFIHVNVLPSPRDPRIVRYISFALLLIAVATLLVYVLR